MPGCVEWVDWYYLHMNGYLNILWCLLCCFSLSRLRSIFWYIKWLLSTALHTKVIYLLLMLYDGKLVHSEWLCVLSFAISDWKMPETRILWLCKIHCLSFLGHYIKFLLHSFFSPNSEFWKGGSMASPFCTLPDELQ